MANQWKFWLWILVHWELKIASSGIRVQWEWKPIQSDIIIFFSLSLFLSLSFSFSLSLSFYLSLSLSLSVCLCLSFSLSLCLSLSVHSRQGAKHNMYYSRTALGSIRLEERMRASRYRHCSPDVGFAFGARRGSEIHRQLYQSRLLSRHRHWKGNNRLVRVSVAA